MDWEGNHAMEERSPCRDALKGIGNVAGNARLSV